MGALETLPPLKHKGPNARTFRPLDIAQEIRAYYRVPPHLWRNTLPYGSLVPMDHA